MPSALAAANRHQRDRVPGANNADKPNAAARNGDMKILGNASITQIFMLCGASTVAATSARLVLATTSAKTQSAIQKFRLCLRMTSVNPVGTMETTPNTAMNRRASPNAYIPEDASLSGPLVRSM